MNTVNSVNNLHIPNEMTSVCLSDSESDNDTEHSKIVHYYDKNYVDELLELEDDDTEETEYIKPIIDILTEDEQIDLDKNIQELMFEYLDTNLVLFTTTHFRETMVHEITEIVYETIKPLLNICDNDDYDEDEEFYMDDTKKYVKTVIDELFDIYGDNPLMHFQPKPVAMNCDVITKIITSLRGEDEHGQRTPEWYEARHHMLTASSIWKILGSEKQRNSYIYEKSCPYKERGPCGLGSPMHWGVKYEPLTVKIYEELNNTRLGEFGLIKHPTHPFIGASPDGINLDMTSHKYGIMTEIKNIYNREITGIPKNEYWIQMQVQMEVCNLDLCDFIETRFKEYSVGEFLEDTEHKKGVIIMSYALPMLTEVHYDYLPFSCITEEEIEEWLKEHFNGQRFVFSTVLYWYLDEYSCVSVKRDRDWFASALPMLIHSHNEIERFRKEGGNDIIKPKQRTIVVRKLDIDVD